MNGEWSRVITKQSELLSVLCCRLYVSPKLPPTPVQKKVTPREWLSEGHHKEGEDLPSLDDVRKSLMYNIDEAENLGDMPSYKRLSG